MTTVIEYALMAGASYISNRDLKNQIPVPHNWSRVSYVQPKPSGFEAAAFGNGIDITSSTEIVISFAGTDFGKGAPDAFFTGDFWQGNIPLITGANINGANQLVDAVEYYLQIKASAPEDATITLTGHSLGGALAALVGVFFGRAAFTFDQVPAAATARSSNAIRLHDALILRGHTELELAGLNNYISLQEANGGFPNEGLITNLNVQGEVAGLLPLASRIGNEASIDNNSPGVSASDLHSIALLTAFLQSSQTAEPFRNLSDASFKLPDLIGMIFDKKLFYNDPLNLAPGAPENFLERLVKHEATVINPATGNTDDMVTRFTRDLWKIAQDGGLTLHDGSTSDPSDPENPNPNAVSKALIAFAMQFYSESPNAIGTGRELFNTEGLIGSIRFDMNDVSASLSNAKGYTSYFINYLRDSAFSPQAQAAMAALVPALRDWAIQAGTGGMTAADTRNRGALLLGGALDDTLTGGDASDLLIGNGSADTLEGGKGNDILIGGAGNDIYILNADSGFDTIFDGDGSGVIRFGTVDALGSTGIDPTKWLHSPNTDTWTDQQNGISYIKSVVDGETRLTVKHGTSTVVVRGWSDNDLGISLGMGGTTVAASPPTTSHPLAGDFKPIDFDPEAEGIQEYYDHLDNVVAGSEVDPDRNDILYDSDVNDLIQGGGGDDTLIAFRGGDDWLEGNAGRDNVSGGAGADLLFADNFVSLESTLAQPEYGGATLDGTYGDFLSGGTGDDSLVGSDQSDALMGGEGDDLILGGAGHDVIFGDASYVGQSTAWTFGGLAVTHPAADYVDLGLGNGQGLSPVMGALDTGVGGDDIIYGLGYQIGTPSTIQTKAADNPLDNHSIVTLTDALVIPSLYTQLAPSLSQEQLNIPIDTRGTGNSTTLEWALDALCVLLLEDDSNEWRLAA